MIKQHKSTGSAENASSSVSLNSSADAAAAQDYVQAEPLPENTGEILPAAEEIHDICAPEYNGRQRINAVLNYQRTHGNRYVQFYAENRAHATLDPQTAHKIEDNLGKGHPLPQDIIGAIAPGLGHDLSGVQVHTDPEADSLVRQTGAAAFTTGNDIFFRQDTYDPVTEKGRRLLAHELAHTIQQESSLSSQSEIIPCTDRALEEEADIAAEAALSGQSYEIGGKAQGQVQFGDEDESLWDRFVNWLYGEEPQEEGTRGVEGATSRGAEGDRGAGGARPQGGRARPQGAREGTMPEELQDALAGEFMQGISYVLLVPLRDTAIAAITDEEVAFQLREARSALRNIPFTVQWIKRAWDLGQRASHIREAIRAFHAWGQINAMEDPEGYAREAGRALAAVGQLGSDFTPDAFGGVKQYFEMLSTCGNFFTRMQNMMDREQQLQRSGMYRGSLPHEQEEMNVFEGSGHRSARE